MRRKSSPRGMNLSQLLWCFRLCCQVKPHTFFMSCSVMFYEVLLRKTMSSREIHHSWLAWAVVICFCLEGIGSWLREQNIFAFIFMTSNLIELRMNKNWSWLMLIFKVFTTIHSGHWISFRMTSDCKAVKKWNPSLIKLCRYFGPLTLG